MLEREDFAAGDGADAGGMVFGIHGIDIPEGVVVEGAEDDVFDDYALLAGLGEEVLEAGEVFIIVFCEVVFLVVDEWPGADVVGGAEGVVGDAEGAGDFAIGAGEGAGLIEVIFGEFFEVGEVIEIEIHDCAVMFGRAYEDGGFVAEEEVVGVVRVEGERFVICRGEEGQEGEEG